MPYKNPKDRKKQKNPRVGTKAHEARMERQRARRAMDRTGRDANKTAKPISVRVKTLATRRC